MVSQFEKEDLFGKKTYYPKIKTTNNTATNQENIIKIGKLMFFQKKTILTFKIMKKIL